MEADREEKVNVHETVQKIFCFIFSAELNTDTRMCLNTLWPKVCGHPLVQ